MHPVLLTIDLDGWRLPLLPWLSLVTVAASAAALIGWRMRRFELTLGAATAALVGGVAAVVLRERVFVPRSLVVTTYGALLAASLILGWWWTVRETDAQGIDRSRVTRALLTSAFVGLVGARIGHVLINWAPGNHWTYWFALQGGGLSGYAGLAAGCGALAMSMPGSGPSWHRVADAASPPIAFGMAALGAGAYFSGGGYGKLLSDGAPAWLQGLGTFPRWPETVLDGAGSPPWVDQVARGVVDVHALVSAPVHPTQLYLLLGALLLAAVVAREQRARRSSGRPFLVLMFGYGSLRVVIDCWRDDPQRLLLGPAVPAWVLVGGALLVLGTVFMLGPARAIERLRWRQGVWALVLGIAPLVALVAVGAGAVRPSLSQCLALLSASSVAWWWRRWERVGESEG